MGKSSKDINKLLFVPIVDDAKLILLKLEVDRTPVIGADMRDNFLKRGPHFEEGRFSNKERYGFSAS